MGDSLFGEAMMKKLVASLAVATLVVAQPLAAATRSSESLPSHGVQTTQAAERAGSITGESDALKGSPIIIIGLVFLVLAGLLALGGSSDSPG
jgi:hypothetical protein